MTANDDPAMNSPHANVFKDKALDAFMTTKFQIDAMLERLKALMKRPKSFCNECPQ